MKRSLSYLFPLILMGLSCGQEPVSDVKIVGGRLVAEGDLELLSTVALTSRGRASCTGTLISQTYVVTAAHCLGSRKPTITFGLNASRGQDVETLRSIKHPGGFDIGLIELAGEPPEWSEPVEILPDEVTLKRGDALILSGYGQTSPSGGGGGQLKTVTSIFDQFNVEKKEIWFGPTPGLSACRGDSGGPAYIKDGDKLFLIGATNGGHSLPACSGSGRYADVRAHRDWIESYTGKL